MPVKRSLLLFMILTVPHGAAVLFTVAGIESAPLNPVEPCLQPTRVGMQGPSRK